MLPAVMNRLSSISTASVDRRVASALKRSIAYYAKRPDEIDERLAELDREWDVERAFEAMSSSVGLAGLALAARYDRRFLLLPAAAGLLLAQHALRGWSPTLPLLRRFGLRTAYEIELERSALRTIRGDFARLERLRPAERKAAEPAERKSAKRAKSAKSASATTRSARPKRSRSTAQESQPQA